MNAAQIAAYEAGILSPMRRRGARPRRDRPSGPATTAWFVTPSGYLVEAQYNTDAGTATWSKILLGMVGATRSPSTTRTQPWWPRSAPAASCSSSRTRKHRDVREYADDRRLGDGGNVARTDTFGDYANVVIVKGTTGALADLVANPANWTNAATFAAPITSAGSAPTSRSW